MKKKVYSLLSLVVSFVLAFGMVSFAADGEAAFSIESISDVNVGDTISLAVNLKSTVELNSIGMYDLKFDDKILKFIGCTEHDVIDAKAMFKTWDTDPLFVALGLGESVVFNESNGKLCSLSFEVLSAGETTVSISGIAKDDSKEYNVSVVDGKVSVVGATDESDNKTDDGETVIDKEEISEDVMTSEKRAKDIICLKIDKAYAYTFGNLTSIDSANDKVVPYIVNDRTLVPLRFVSETLGADVLWEDGWNYCYVNKGDKKIKITFGSADLEVNGEVITYEAPVQVVENRTMVPIRFISEELGYHVHWNQPNKAVVISPADNPWVKDRDAEKSLLTDILVMFLMKGMA